MSQKARPIVLQAITFLAYAKGEMGRTGKPGLAVFSPLPNTQSQGAFLTGKGLMIAEGHTRLHVLSVRRPRKIKDQNNPIATVDCQTFEDTPIQRNNQSSYNSWWSIPLVEYASKEERDIALETLREQRVTNAAMSIEEMLQEANNILSDPKQDARAKATSKLFLSTIKAMEESRMNEETTPDCDKEFLDKRFDLTNAIIIYHRSGAPNDEKAIWANPTRNRGGRNQQSTPDQDLGIGVGTESMGFEG